MVLYVDSSALAKLIRVEAESSSLQEYLNQQGDNLATSVLGRVELFRVAMRERSLPNSRIGDVLDSVVQMDITEAVVRSAESIPPAWLRALDAIHVASALQLGDECNGVITYDARMAGACRLAGLTVVAPA